MQRAGFVLIIAAAICGRAVAAEKVVIHENLKVDQKVSFALTQDYHSKTTTTVSGKPPEVSDMQTRQSWKITMTLLGVKDGSATQARVDVDPASVDASKNGADEEQKTTPAFAGKTVTLTRQPDDSVASDFTGDASPDDVETIKGFLNPDQDFYPDHPVAVGDTWEISDKLGKHSELGPKDRLLADCRLDWVKTIDGKSMAQISCSCATIRHEEGNVEEDVESQSTLTVDIPAGMVVKCDQTGTSKYSTPAGEPAQVTGGTTFSFHTYVLSNEQSPATGAATQP